MFDENPHCGLRAVRQTAKPAVRYHLIFSRFFRSLICSHISKHLIYGGNAAFSFFL
jgi:hypothetical protein